MRWKYPLMHVLSSHVSLHDKKTRANTTPPTLHECTNSNSTPSCICFHVQHVRKVQIFCRLFFRFIQWLLKLPPSRWQVRSFMAHRTSIYAKFFERCPSKITSVAVAVLSLFHSVCLKNQHNLRTYLISSDIFRLLQSEK